MDSKQLKDLITQVLWRMEVNLNRDTKLSEAEHTPERDGAKYNSTDAINLILGTAFVESDCGHFIEQKAGRALGIFQMEIATHDDIYTNYINSRPLLKSLLKLGYAPKAENLKFDLRYATMMTRLHYYRVSEPLPKFKTHEKKADYSLKLGRYWKEHYNTELGKGKVFDFISKWEKYV